MRQKRLNTSITVHPGRMDEPPDDPGLFFRRRVRNHIAIWLKRHGCRVWYAIWTRENYEGEGREHLHVLAYVPVSLRSALAEAVARWWPGVDATKAERVDEPRVVFGYMAKQLTSKAHWVTRRRHDGRPTIRYEKFCRYTGAPVAAVLGKRCGVTNDLKRAVRERRAQSARLQAQGAARAG